MLTAQLLQFSARSETSRSISRTNTSITKHRSSHAPCPRALGGLLRRARPQITKFSFETIGRAPDRLRICRAIASRSSCKCFGDSARKIWHSSRQQVFISAQPCQALGFTPQYFCGSTQGQSRCWRRHNGLRFLLIVVVDSVTDLRRVHKASVPAAGKQPPLYLRQGEPFLTARSQGPQLESAVSTYSPRSRCP